MNTQPRVSVIIRSYNEERFIGRLLAGLKSQKLQDFETIVVDSGSTDRTIDIASGHGARVVHISKTDFSFGRSLNRGCHAARGEILVFASAHVYPLRTDWLSTLVAPFNSPDIVLSYGRQVGDDSTKFSEHRVFASWFPSKSLARQQHYFCNNANCAVRRTAWEAQGYNEHLTGLEDLAWAKQAREQGGQIAYVAEAVIAHVHDESWSKVRNRYRREAMALRRIEPGLRFGFLDFVWLALSNILADASAALGQKSLFREWRSILQFRLNQFFGTWQGHRKPSEIDEALRSRLYYPSDDKRPPALQRQIDVPREDGAFIEYEF